MLCLFILLSLSSVLCDEKDGGKAYRIPLNDGNSIPAIGLGTFLGFDDKGQKKVSEHEVEYPVKWALDAGYRMIDTAAAYHDEEQVGAGVRSSSVPRENVFIVTKLPWDEKRDVVGSLKKSLARLNMSYVDLYLIHFPISIKPDFSEYDIIDYLDTWKGMEETKNLGLAKSIGISNFNTSQIDRLLANCQIKPAVLQIEVNLNLAQERLISLCKNHNITVMAYTPFGSLFSKDTKPPPPRADDPVLVEMAKKYGKTTPQIVLRYLIQKGVVPIPKTLHKNRVEENIDVFDFTLTDEEYNTLSKFNKDYRVVFPSFWQDHPYYPFEKVDVPAPDLFKGKL
ncbi:aldo-keto reductase AKR2E4-like [Anticarsia gemmatalis]|uniref:aldo-keto reductase AKR2E4-like n=1 Tax=Anticarsia gemmatalis TaxID=129554 RepID=UPI003F765F6D